MCSRSCACRPSCWTSTRPRPGCWKRTASSRRASCAGRCANAARFTTCACSPASVKDESPDAHRAWRDRVRCRYRVAFVARRPAPRPIITGENRSVEAFLDWLNGVIWSKALIALCLGAGLWFSIRTRFMQLRSVREMVRLLLSGKSSEAGVSSFQALAMSLSGRVGIGNIAGVATAIAFGGPGAVFWMWVMAFLGASTAYVESTLAQIYKERDDEGRYRGGPAYYIEKAMGQKWYAWLFAIATIMATGFFLPGVQANGIASGMANAWNIPVTVTATGVVLALGFIIFGGVKRIARFAELVVPFMALAYMLVAFVIMVLNAEQVPQMVSLIFRSAFGMEAGFGAMLGLAVEWGVMRGIYSNEAGQGTGPHAAAAAEVSRSEEHTSE